jgi:prolyl-tRNA editing enzyme YbaK/EbsC (Cys-tRNA(Pro) deacylase)
LKAFSAGAIVLMISKFLDRGGGIMGKELSASAKKVQDALKSRGISCEVLELPSSTRTAQEAADSVGCEVGQIVKSLIFKAKQTERAILVVASGSNRVNEKKLSEWMSEPVGRADADFVREKTGFAIGGVPPVGHKEDLVTFIDEDLFGYETIWAAAGTPHAVFKLTPDELKQMTGGKKVSVK